MTRLLEGKIIAQRLKEDLRKRIEKLKIKPLLSSVLVGEDSSAQIYINAQKKLSQDLGIGYQLYTLSKDTTEDYLIDFIQRLNLDKTVNGIIIQMPLPERLNRKKIIKAISPYKDVEGIHPTNLGRIFFGDTQVLPCTVLAVIELLRETRVNLYGKEVVIIGHSEIVGKPLSILLLNEFATVTVCHIATSDVGRLKEHVQRAEVLIVAVGKANLIKGEWIKEGAIVIDVGINKLGEKIVGDVEFDKAKEKTSFITPVPGGVGALTTVMLIKNLISLIEESF
ncbi:MAG: bifunctional 5,10-methylenetetrahydrofolate dehydrogenase/5,10-methenyltetrahydrofolate cyclohydrolase [Candidatus Omnitrophica bacterium]|nr:bifunctional 5,10-methylenetetrahydrofolate dehydrogenase/5,10-methenyltetrahydrofolate cyclohydrolase [Candidatus Omnitrophota bacterium]